MKYKQINQGRRQALSVIGLGTWAMGGPNWSGGWGPQPDNDSVETIKKAADCGINWLDTAPIYGLGHAEKVVGKAIQQSRKDWFIAGKCGLSWSKKGKIRKDLTPFRIRQEIEESLGRLQTEYIDLYQIHWPDDKFPVEKSWKAILKLKQEGKIRFAGVCNFDVAMLKRCLEVGLVDTVQVPYNLMRREIENELLPFCIENDIAVLAYSPLHSGLLSGKFNPEHLANRDWRKRHPDFSGEGLERRKPVLQALANLAEKKEVSMAELALSWVLKQPGITAVIVGARSPRQLAQLVAAAEFEWSESELDRITQITEIWKKPRAKNH